MGQRLVRADRFAVSIIKDSKIKLAAVLLMGVASVSALALGLPGVAHAACSPPAANYGTATMTVNVPSGGSFRVWSRIMVPDTANNTYMLQVDPTSTNGCYTVGGGTATIPANAWKWVDYQNGNVASKIDINLSAGSHTLVMIGTQPSVKLDRVMLLADTSCVPKDSGTGDDCASLDITPPTVQINSPSNGATVSGTVPVTLTASDSSVANGVAKVELYVNGALKDTSTTAGAGSKYNFSWNTTSLPTGTYVLKATAYDASGNTNTDSISVKLQQSDTKAPTTPNGVTATASSTTAVVVHWKASTDDIAVTDYRILRSTGNASPTPFQQVNGSSLSFTDTAVAAGTKYNYQIIALDAAGNTSSVSTIASVTTPQLQQPDKQAPSVPSGLTATAANNNQINLSWQPSTDNVGVTAYDIYRAKGSSQLTKLTSIPVLISSATSTPTRVTYGDGNLASKTTYHYAVVARDAGGNTSAKSATASTTTPQAPSTNTGRGEINGWMEDKQDRRLAGATVTLTIGTTKHTYVTNPDGTYHIYGIPAGTYKVRYEDRGFWFQVIPIKVKANKVTFQEVVMTRQ